MAVLSPLGLILPPFFSAGSAWGEWGVSEIRKLVGYVPVGLQKISLFWNAPFSDYAFKGWEEKEIAHLSFSYVMSAFVGVGITVFVVSLVGKYLSKKND